MIRLVFLSSSSGGDMREDGLKRAEEAGMGGACREEAPGAYHPEGGC